MDKNTMLDELVLRFDMDNYMDGEQSLWQHKTDVAALTPVYAKLNRRFPPIYEHLLLNYRWTCGDTDAVCFWANPPGPDLVAFFESYFRDKYLVQFCLDNGYLPFGGAANGGYDPVCFDCNKGSSTDRPVVQLCHESILVGHHIKVVQNLFSSFESLVLRVISDDK
ncbi:MAG: hypothetical protein IPO31_07840 [Candidatus Obscuribacter sp.]|nr:hypothetical protein [Candidatus Obscuribacter sp.]